MYLHYTKFYGTMYLTTCEKGTVTVDEVGRTFFEADENGRHSYLTMNVPEGKAEQDIKDACGKYLDDTAIELYERL